MASGEPVSLYPGIKATYTPQEASRAVTLASHIHQADTFLRKHVSDTLKASQQGIIDNFTEGRLDYDYIVDINLIWTWVDYL